MAFARLLAVTASIPLVVACTAADDVTAPRTAPVATTATAPATAAPSDVPAATPVASAPSSEPASTTNTTTPFATSTTTSTTTAQRAAVELDESRVITRVGVFGDSLVADLTAIGGRDNQVVPQIAELLISDDHLAVERVENLALPGQSVVADLGLLPPSDATLRPYVEQTLAAQPDRVELAVIAISSSDINVNASLPEPDAISQLAEEMLAELSTVAASFRAAGVDVVFLPIFGINDTVFLDLRCALKPSCPPGPDAQIERINSFFWESELPMLFESFGDQLDQDGDGRTDRLWFDGVDARFPDDGVHPNAEGQRLYSTAVFNALRTLLDTS